MTAVPLCLHIHRKCQAVNCTKLSKRVPTIAVILSQPLVSTPHPHWYVTVCPAGINGSRCSHCVNAKVFSLACFVYRIAYPGAPVCLSYTMAWGICLSVCLSVCLSYTIAWGVCLSVCLSYTMAWVTVCLSVCLSVVHHSLGRLSVCLSVVHHGLG